MMAKMEAGLGIRARTCLVSESRFRSRKCKMTEFNKLGVLLSYAMALLKVKSPSNLLRVLKPYKRFF